MSTDPENSLDDHDWSDDIHAKLMKRLQEMSAREIFQTCIQAGIYDEEGNLTERYKSNSED